MKLNSTTSSRWEGEAPAEPMLSGTVRLGGSLALPARCSRSLKTQRGRAAFTLIELLVVMAIIAILMALLAAAVMKMLNVPPQKNTELLIQKLTASLEQQWKATIDTAKSEAPNPGLWGQAQAMAPGGDNQKVMDAYVKLRLQQEFPTSFGAAQATGKPLYQQVLNGVPPPPTQPYGISPESSICLYTVITVGRRGMNFDASGLSPRELRDVGGKKGLYDGWDQPIQFRTMDDPNTGSLKFQIYSTGANRKDEQGGGDDVSSDTLRLGR